MPIIFGQAASSVEEILDAFERHGERVRGTYRAHYRFDADTRDPYEAPRLERPASLRENPPGVLYPWEQIFVAAAACAGSDYPMLAAHFGIPLERIDFMVEGVFDPRGEFDGLGGFEAAAAARHCYPALLAELERAGEPDGVARGEVLDCGVGTGAFSLALAEAGVRPVRLHGIDIAPRMLEEARRVLGAGGLELVLRLHDLCDLPFGNDRFAMVRCAHALVGRKVDHSVRSAVEGSSAAARRAGSHAAAAATTSRNATTEP